MKNIKKESEGWDNYFWDFINKIAKDNCYCPRCLVDLELKTVGKEHYEIQGANVSEDVKVLTCPQCQNTYK